MNVKFIDSFETIGEKAWNALVAKSPTNTIFQTWAWQEAWWRAQACPGRELRLVVVYDGNELRAAFSGGQDIEVHWFGRGGPDRLDL
jgi:CelD/BcsL family acetyltransferase involved in cellulose biosynthesis